MDFAAKLEACQKWGRPIRILYGECHDELVAHVEEVENGRVTFELVGGQGILDIPLDDLHDILYPNLREVRSGVFEVVKNSGPIC